MGKVKKLRKNKNDEEYKRLFFDTFYQKVYNTAYSVIKDPHLAQDIVQDTFLKFYQQIDHMQKIDNIDSWISTITYRTAIDYYRKKKKWETFITEEKYIDTIGLNGLASSIEEMTESKMLENILREIILKLDIVEQHILILKYEYKLTDDEIGSILNIPSGTVKSKLHRVKQKISEALSNHIKVEEGVGE